MSDEFIKVAENEIKEELDGIFKILELCKSDQDVLEKSSEFKRHFHKIKGLAPMIGQQGMGEIAFLNDSLIEKVLESIQVTGIFETISESTQLMKKLMEDSTIGFDELKQAIKTKHSVFLE